MEEKAPHFGEHYMLDGYGGDYEKLNDKDLVMLSLTDLPSRLEMNILAEPIIVKAPANNIKDPGGWSGFVVIAESHISIHTFPARGFVSVDIYTCKNGLDKEAAKKYFQEMFNLQDIEENFVLRGTRYPSEDIHKR